MQTMQKQQKLKLRYCDVLELDLSNYQVQSPTSTKLQTIVMKNNGKPFSDEDWIRLCKIAEGNPDEDSVGCFGVGFYR
jgi:hypothetical protein